MTPLPTLQGYLKQLGRKFYPCLLLIDHKASIVDLSYLLIFTLLQEEEEHEEGHESDSDDEETVLYNPKNLPLGWDGKV